MKNNQLHPINQFINRLNKSGFVLLIGIYIALLVFLLFVLTPKRDYVVVPNYSHDLFNEEINAQITVVGLRTFDEEENMTTKYSILARLQGRRPEDNLDPNLQLERFQLSSYLENGKMYYFTEQSGNKTPITHSYTMYKEAEETIPSSFFVSVQYQDLEGASKVATFYEQMMLSLTNKEIYTNTNKLTHIESIEGVDTEVTDAKIAFIATSDTKNYTVSVRITIPKMSEDYHVDMQSWYVDDQGEAYPFIGVYGYADQRSTFNHANRPIPKQINPVSIYSKLNFYRDEALVGTINYTQLINNLPNNFGTEPTPDLQPDNPAPTPLFTTTEWIIAGTVFAGLAAASVGYYIFDKKRKQSTHPKE